MRHLLSARLERKEFHDETRVDSNSSNLVGGSWRVLEAYRRQIEDLERQDGMAP
jgi:hypothetical protein